MSQASAPAKKQPPAGNAAETATDQAMSMKAAEPQPEHDWLQRLVGDWTYEAHVPAHATHPESHATGTERVRTVGGLWIQAEGSGEMPGGGPATTLMTLGFDPSTRRFVGTWIGSMMTHMWIYDGELDASRKVLTLTSDGPSMSGDGTMSRYRDVIELSSDDHRTLTASVLGGDGAWQPFMTMTYHRAKPPV
jgi:hypothetical protein